jgi:hypothetical protein
MSDHECRHDRAPPLVRSFIGSCGWACKREAAIDSPVPALLKRPVKLIAFIAAIGGQQQ